MDIFISWSGDRSKVVAEAFAHWLPRAMRSVKPWLSSFDIEQGARWNESINAGLSKAKAGIICLTRSNLDKRSILFEAGAISRSVTETGVYTLLSELEPADLIWPLAQFQATRLLRGEIQKMCRDLNRAVAQCSEDFVPEEMFDNNFDVWWPTLEAALSQLPQEIGAIVQTRPERELLEEILELIRAQSRPPVKSMIDTLSSTDDALIRSLNDIDWDNKAVELSAYQLLEIKKICLEALEQSGHATAAALLNGGDWESDRSVLKIAIDSKRTMCSLVFNTDCKKILSRALRSRAFAKPLAIISANTTDQGGWITVIQRA